MKSASFVLIALAVMTHVAVAQPGATPPTGEMPPPNAQVDAQAGMPAPMPPQQPPPSNDALLDQAIAKAQAEMPTLVTVAKGTLRRARRAVAIGPTIGLWSAAYVEPGEVDAALTVGIGFETFKVPVVPDTDTLKALVVERVKAQAKDRIKAVFAGRAVDPVALDQIVLQVYEDVRKEILGLENVRSKTLERPQFTVAFEADRRFGADRWLGRTRVGIGIWKLTFALSASFGKACRGDGCDDRVRGFIGPEVVLHVIPKKNPRANVIDAFLRFDIQATGRADTAHYDQMVIGVRYLVDVI
jgi:hypothetical protein